jgi:transposase InsO family protein
MKKAESHLNISQLCQLMNVPIASYYYHPTDKPETAQYLDKMKVIHKENFQAYDRRRMRVALKNQGIQMGVFKITRLTVLDLDSRQIVDYALSQTPDARLTRQALLNAIKMQAPDTL